MSVDFCERTGLFHIRAGGSSYVMQLFKGSYPAHLYWGKRIDGGGFDRLLTPENRAFSPNPDPGDKSYSLDTLPQEYPSAGGSDFRIPAFTAERENGTSVAVPFYSSHRITDGKPILSGLPSTYVEDSSEARTLEIELLDAGTGLRVILSYTAFERFDAITRSVRFVNEGAEDLKLTGAMSMSMDFPGSAYELLQLSGSWARERHVVKRRLVPGLQALESRRGASSHQQNPFFALLSGNADEDAGEVFGFSLVYSGNFTAGVEVDQFGSARTFMGINPSGFGRLLLPGESFQTPEVVLVHSSEGLGGMSRTYHALYRTRLCRGVFRDRRRPVLINNWEATYFDFDADRLVSIAESAAELGIELLVLDDGWFGKRNDDRSSLGDWMVNREKLPGGLEDLSVRLSGLGMKLGLWFEPEMVSPDSDLYRRHPDWCLRAPDRSVSESRNQLVLDLTREEVRTAVLDMITTILEKVPVAYVKWDCNRHLTEVGSYALPSERQGETAHRYILGLYSLLDALVSRFPDILFESCSGGGGRFDPGMLYYMPQGWTSDDTDAAERLKIQYGTSLVYPPSAMAAHVSAVPNHQVGRITPLVTRGHAAMYGSFGYELDLSGLSDAERETVRRQVSEYRDIEELIRTGNLYRLRSPFEGNDSCWMFVSCDRKRAVLFFVRMLAEPNAPSVRVFLRGIDPGREYGIEGTEGVWGGDFLMHAGIAVVLPDGDFQSRVLKFTAVSTNDGGRDEHRFER